MAIQRADYDGVPEASIRLWCSNWNKDHVQMDFELTIYAIDIEWKDPEFGKGTGESIERTPANL